MVGFLRAISILNTVIAIPKMTGPAFPYSDITSVKAVVAPAQNE